MRGSDANVLRAVVVLTLTLACSHAPAEAPNGQAALVRAQSLLRQLNDQKQSLELENAKLKSTNASLEKELKHGKIEAAEVNSRLTERKQEIDHAKGNLARAKARNDQLTARLEEIVAKYKDTARSLHQAEVAKARLEGELDAGKAALTDAEKKNLALYQTGRQILEKYKHKPRWTALLQKEPFTGIKQVEIESAVEGYEYDMAEQLLDTNLDAAGPAAGASEDPAAGAAH